MNKYIYTFIACFVVLAGLIFFAGGRVVDAPMYVRLPLMLALFGGCGGSLYMYMRAKEGKDD